MIYTSVIIAKLLYAASAWWGSLQQLLTVSASKHLSNEASALEWTVWRWCFITGRNGRLSWRRSFQRILYNPNHVLNSLLPDLNATGHYLRHRRHDRVLPPKTGSLQINNCLIRQLYTRTSINTQCICLARLVLTFCILLFYNSCLLFFVRGAFWRIFNKRILDGIIVAWWRKHTAPRSRLQWTCKARSTLTTKLNPTHSTLLKVDCRRNWQQIGKKVECCRYGQLCCRFRQQIGNDLNSTVCRGRLCCRYGRLHRQCVRSQSNTVDFRPCWIQLCRQCVPGFTDLVNL